MIAPLLSLFLLPVAFASPLSTSSVVTTRQATGTLAPLHDAVPSPIANSYIVVLKEDVDAATLFSHLNFLQDAHAADPLHGEDDGLKHVYDSGIQGYAGRFTESTVDKIRSQPEVDYVEQDQIVWASDVENGAPWVCNFRHVAFINIFAKPAYINRGLPESATARS